MDNKNVYNYTADPTVFPQGARYTTESRIHETQRSPQQPNIQQNRQRITPFSANPGGFASINPMTQITQPRPPRVKYRQGGMLSPYESNTMDDVYSYAKLPNEMQNYQMPHFDRNPGPAINDPRVVIQRIEDDFNQFASQKTLENSNSIGQTGLPTELNPISNNERKSYDRHNKHIGHTSDQSDQSEEFENFVALENDNQSQKPGVEIPSDPSEAPLNLQTRLNRSIFGDVQLANSAYPYAYMNQPFLQAPQSNLILNPKPFYLSIDSRDRDRKTWPNPAKYQIPLVASDTVDIHVPGQEYRNVHSIELMSAVVPRRTDCLNEPYLLLQIDEIQNTYHATNLATTKAFVKLHFNENITECPFLILDRDLSEPLTRYYYPKPLASLAKMTISIRKHDGTLFNFGTDTNPDLPPNPRVQNTFTFKIITYIPNVNQAIGQRNI